MKTISLVVDDFYAKNRIFDELDTIVNRDDCMRPWIELRKSLLNIGLTLNTHDLAERPADLYIFQNIPEPDSQTFQAAIKSSNPLIALINELTHIHKRNIQSGLHDYFSIVFTYQDNLIDNIKYRKLNYSFRIPREISGKFDRPIFSAMIAGNKMLRHRAALYKERIKTIEWFELRHPDKFKLFGRDWNKPTISLDKPSLSSRILRKVFGSAFVNAPTYATYCGEVKAKNEILSQTKFSICYENAADSPGWITEKIFDVFFAGSIPVYWGAPNVTDHIPQNLFIDRRKFKSHEELYDHMMSWQEKDYEIWLANLNAYLKSDQIKEFSVENFVTEMTRAIVELLDGKRREKTETT